MATLTDPEAMIDWDGYFEQQAIQAGHGASFFQGKMYQRGHGLGNIFRGIFKFLMPMAKSVAKTVGKQALHTGFDIVSDTIKGQNIKQAAKQRGREAAGKLLDAVKSNISQSGNGRIQKRQQSGNGIKRKGPARKKSVKLGIAKQQKRKGDLFDF